jgi:hypothetical protein
MAGIGRIIRTRGDTQSAQNYLELIVKKLKADG